MMFIKKLASIAALSLSAIASISYAGSAHALGFSYSAGAYRDSATNQGAFSEQVNNKGYTTLDFNDGNAPNSNGVKYTFSNGTSYKALSGQTGIYSDKWAPSGVVGTDVNYSKYLAVFSNSTVTIENTKDKVFNYFGFDAGALSVGNTLSFFKGGSLVKELTYDMMNAAAKVSSNAHGGQLNGFFEFFSEGANDNFDKIVLSQTKGGGFESDNHTFRTGTGKYDAAKVPEPGVALGLLAIGGVFLRNRKNHKSVNLG